MLAKYIVTGTPKTGALQFVVNVVWALVTGVPGQILKLGGAVTVGKQNTVSVATAVATQLKLVVVVKDTVYTPQLAYV